MFRLFRNLILVLFFCEFLIYYLVIFQCKYPETKSSLSNETIKAMLIADTHMLGPFRGHWFDKIRREWQMYRSFQTSLTIFNPEIVFILGDVFDEGNWVDHQGFEEYKRRFRSIFHVPDTTKLIIVVGNHDIGFHYSTHIYLISRFEKSFNTTGVQLITEKDIHFVTINSIAMEGDSCHLCQDAQRQLRSVSKVLDCYRDDSLSEKECRGIKKLPYSQPIILQHFPTFRKSDLRCVEKDSANADKYREKWEVLSRDSTDLIGTMLNPRVVFAGHSHHYCKIEKNRLRIPEITLASFNWRNINNPSFVLATFTPNQHLSSLCKLPKETTVIFIYIIGIFLSFIDASTKFNLFKFLFQKTVVLISKVVMKFRRKTLI